MKVHNKDPGTAKIVEIEYVLILKGGHREYGRLVIHVLRNSYITFETYYTWMIMSMLLHRVLSVHGF